MDEKITVPAWAESIRVEKRGSKLLVWGEGRVENQVAFATGLESSSLDLLNQYVPMMRLHTGSERQSPHVHFARANKEDQQIDFVKAFGPIEGVVKKSRPRLLVEQTLEALRHEQALFAAGSKLLVEIQRQPRDRNVKKLWMRASNLWDCIVDLWDQRDLPVPNESQASMLDLFYKRQGLPYTFDTAMDIPMEDHPDSKAIEAYYDAALHTAHWNVTALLNRFPVGVTFFAGRRVELPVHAPEGILPMLYFMLRRDYLGTGQRLSFCAFEECGSLFQVGRAGQRYCSARHSALQRMRDYWDRKGKKRRKKRRTLARRNANTLDHDKRMPLH